MPTNISEVDWRQFRDLREQILERFCRRVLSELEALLKTSAGTNHQHFLDAFDLLNDRNRELSRAFDAPRRSRMVQQLAAMHVQGLLTLDELALFTPSIRTAVELTAKAVVR